MTAEQYMMAEKALLMGDDDTYEKILQESDPRKQKALGRRVKHWNESKWKKHRVAIVLAGNLAKFSQNVHLKKALLATGKTELVEASPNDTIWGVGLRQSDPRIKDKKTWRGLNLLGQILTQVREMLRAEDEAQAAAKE